jgi:acetylornithine/succinyldiaminopimelate/putrescine aminotransferase
MKERFMNTYARTGLVLDHGAGARLFAADGTEYIDFTAGIGVNSLGHGHPKLVAAMRPRRRSSCMFPTTS